MKKLAIALLICTIVIVLQGCFGFPGFNTNRNSSSNMVPNALTPGSESDLDAPAKAGGLNSGWSNSGSWDRPCQRQFDGSCR